eukprot:782922-Lingulodinium_polyedra.AAC.1
MRAARNGVRRRKQPPSSTEAAPKQHVSSTDAQAAPKAAPGQHPKAAPIRRPSSAQAALKQHPTSTQAALKPQPSSRHAATEQPAS